MSVEFRTLGDYGFEIYISVSVFTPGYTLMEFVCMIFLLLLLFLSYLVPHSIISPPSFLI